MSEHWRAKTMRVSVVAGMLLAGLALGACTRLADAASDPFRMNNTELLDAGFKAHEPLPPPPATYCYRTLAHEMCYRQPLPGEGERLVEAYPPRIYQADEALK
jgi:hypothetical protein